jgi:hypothetical protein
MPSEVGATVNFTTGLGAEYVDAESNHRKTKSHMEALPEFRSSDLDIEPQSLLPREKVPRVLFGRQR